MTPNGPGSRWSRRRVLTLGLAPVAVLATLRVRPDVPDMLYRPLAFDGPFLAVPTAPGLGVELDPEKVNPRGGAIAIGHPLGASGARLMATMLNSLERTGGRYGLQTMCEGGGQANVTIIERL